MNGLTSGSHDLSTIKNGKTERAAETSTPCGK